METPNQSLEKLLNDTDNSRAVLLSILEDQHLKVNELRESQLKYESLFENSPISLWEEDFSDVQLFLKKHCPNPELIESFLDENPEKIYELVSLVKVVDINQATLKLYKAKSKDELIKGLKEVFTEDSFTFFKKLIVNISKKIYELETITINKTLAGDILHIKLKYVVLPGSEETLKRIIVSIIDITEEKEIKDQLLLSEQRFIEAQAIAQFGNWQFDHKTNEIIRSKEIYKIIGEDEQDFEPTFEAFLQNIHKDDLDIYLQTFKQSIENKEPYKITYRFITPKGERKYIIEKGYTFFDDNDQPIRTVGTAQDITNQYLAEQELKESQLQYQVLFDNAPIALFEEDFTQVIKKLYNLGATPDNINQFLEDKNLLQQCLQLVFVNNINQEALRLYNAESKEHFHQHLPNLFTRHSIEVVKKNFIDITQGKSEGAFETTLRKVDGELFHALVRFSVLKYKKDSGKLIFSIENITLRKKLLADIEEQQLNLNQAQKIALIGSFTLNHKDNSIVRTDEFYRIFETTPEELPTREECFLCFVHPEDSAELVKTFHDSVKKNIAYDMQYRIITGKGNLKFIHEKGNTYLDDKGELNKTIGTLQDITEKVLFQNELDKSRASLENTFLNMSDGFVQLDKNFNYLYINKKGAELLNRKIEDLIGKNCWEEFPEDVGTDYYDKCLLAVENQQNIEMINYFDPWKCWFENRIIPTKNGLSIFFQDITRKKENEKKIKEAQTIINNSSLVAFLWKNEENWPVEYVSENVSKLFEVTAEEFYSHHVKYNQFIHPDDYKRVEKFENISKETAAKLKNDFNSFTHEPYRIITKSGHTKWVLDKTLVRRDANNNITHYQGFIEDITEKHFAEIELEKTHQLLENTLSDMTDGFVTINKEWVYTFVNQQAANYLNKAKEELQGAYIWDIFPDGINKLFHIKCQKAFDEQEPIIYEEYFEETQRWFENRIFPSSESLSIFFQDITERKNIEQKTKEAHNVIVNSNSIAIVWENIPTWPIKYVSENIERILGYTAYEMINEIIHFSKIMHQEDLELSNNEAFSFLNNPEIENYKLSPYRVYTKEGKIRWIIERTNVIRNEQGEVIELRGFIDDITEQYQLENAINTILSSVSTVTGNEYLKEITIQLSNILGAEHTFIGLNEKENPLIIKTLYNCYKGEIVDNFSYNLVGTPCYDILNLDACSFPNNVANLFPDDILLKEMEIEGYVGVPLLDSNNQPIGIIVGLFKNPIENTHFTESIIQLFSTRTSAEIVRLRTEEILKETEATYNKQLQKLNVAIDSVKDVVFMTDINGVYTYVNEYFTKLYGYEANEVIGKATPRILKSGLLTKKDYINLWNHLLKKQPVNVEIKNKKKNGQLIDIESSLSAITNDNGEIVGFIAIQRDITEKIKQNILIGQSEKKYRDLFEKSGDANLIIKNNTFIDCNDATLKMVGFKGAKQDFLNVHPSKLSPAIQPDGTPSFEKAENMMALAKEKGTHIFEWIHLKSDGTPFYAEVTLTHIVSEVEDEIIHVTWRDITSKKIAEEQLKESEEEGWALFENSPNLIWIEDYSQIKLRFNTLRKNGVNDLRTYLNDNPEELKIFGDLVIVKKVNKRSLEFYEVDTQEELLGNITDFFVEESFLGFKEELIALFEGKLNYSHEIPIKKYSGQLVYLSLDITIPETNKEKLDKVIVSFSDITEQKRNEKTKEVLLNITKHISEVTSIKEFSAIVKVELSKLIDTNNFYIALYKKEKDSISIPYFKDDIDKKVSVDEDFEAEGSLTGYIIKTKKPLLATQKTFQRLEKEGAVKLIGPDSLIWLGVPLFIKNEVIGAIVVQSYTNANAFSIQDQKILEIVSEQIAIAIERIKYQNSIRENEEKFRSIFELSPDMVNLVDVNGNILDCNEQFVKQLGYNSKEELINVNCIHFISKEDRISAIEKFKFCFIQGQVYNQEFRMTRKDGSTFSAEISAIINYDNNNLPINIIGIVRDITLRKQHELEITNALEKARETDRLKSAFLANMSHEIRTPMNGIIGFAEMLQIQNLDEEKRAFYANIIMNSSRQLLSIINDVLDMSTIETGLVEIKKAPVSINVMLRELHEFFLQKSDEKQLKLTSELTLNDQLSVINTDQTKVQQVLTNFISNAIKFTKKGSVTFGYTLKDSYLEFYVKDTGIGIDKKLHNEVFERFRQVNMEYTRETIGNGLGLSISKKLVELLGGEIWLESEPNKGSTFYFTIPYLEDVLENIVEENITTFNHKALKEQVTILLAEDEEYNRIFIEEILDDKDFKILMAENGVEAVDLAKNNADIMFILMDIKMPIMNGIEACKIIKEFNKTVPIIALTAFSMESDKVHLIKEGFDDYVSKPIVKKDLMNMINKHLFST